MGKGITEWIMGPQIIGILSIIIGLIQERFPPKKINKYYGYRMPSATKNQQTWDDANRHSARAMIKTGIFLLVAGLLFTWLMTVVPMRPKIKFALSYLALMASGMGSAIAVILSTERYLEKTSDQKQL